MAAARVDEVGDGQCKQKTRHVTRLGLARGVVCMQSSGWCAAKVGWCVWSGYLLITGAYFIALRSSPFPLVTLRESASHASRRKGSESRYRAFESPEAQSTGCETD